MKVLFAVIALMVTAWGQTIPTWTARPAPKNPQNATVVGTKGWNWKLPYDNYNGGFLYYGGQGAGNTGTTIKEVSIYSTQIGLWKSSDGTWTMLQDAWSPYYTGVQADSTNICPVGSTPGYADTTHFTAYPIHNPGTGHPDGYPSYDTRRHRWFHIMPICNTLFLPFISQYDTVSNAMLPQVPFGPYPFIFYVPNESPDGARTHFSITTASLGMTGQSQMVYVNGTRMLGDFVLDTSCNGGYYCGINLPTAPAAGSTVRIVVGSSAVQPNWENVTFVPGPKPEQDMFIFCCSSESAYFAKAWFPDPNGVSQVVNQRTASYTLTTTDFLYNKTIQLLSTSALTVTLPSATVAMNQFVFVQNASGVNGTVTVGASGKTLNGGTSDLTVPPNSRVVLMSDGTNYWTPENWVVPAPAGSAPWVSMVDYLKGEEQSLSPLKTCNNQATGTSISVTVDATAKTFTRASGAYKTTDGLAVGEYVTWAGTFANAGNKSQFLVTALTDTVMTVADPTNLMVSEGPIASASYTSSSPNCMPKTLQDSQMWYNPNDGYVYIFGGATGLITTNSDESTLNSTATYRLDTTQSPWVMSKMTDLGVAIDKIGVAFPIATLDTNANRIIYVIDRTIDRPPALFQMYEGRIAGKTITWATLGNSSSSPPAGAPVAFTSALAAENDSQVHAATGFDPVQNKMVVLRSGGQGSNPTFNELSLGSIAPIAVQETLIPPFTNKNSPLGAGSAYTKQFTGLDRTDEIVTVGIPLSESSGLTTSQLAVSGASSYQFRSLGTWPSNGKPKWVQVDAVVPSVPAGQVVGLSLVPGSGNSGAGMATDNGTTITVATGAATFTIRKANFDGLNKVVVGSTTLADSSVNQSDGLVVIGPASGVVCSTPPTDCATEYKSVNDASSTASIEYDGPVHTVIKVTGNLMNGATTYLPYTLRIHFYRNKSYIKLQSELKNVSSASNKGYSSYEFRLKTTLGASRTTVFATNSATAGGLNESTSDGTTSYSVTSGGENVYEYQAYSTRFIDTSANTALLTSPLISKNTGVYDQQGYQVVHGTTVLNSGTADQYSEGWGDLTDSTNYGILVGVPFMSGQWPKSVQFMAGGDEVRVGMWPNQGLMQQTPTYNGPYYIPYPQYLQDEILLNFHAPWSGTTAANEWFRMQNPLIAHSTPAYYNSTDAIPWKLLEANKQDALYVDIGSRAIPAIGSTRWCCSRDMEPAYVQRYGWNATGGDNSSDFRIDYWQRFVTRGWSGDYLWARLFNKYIMERAWPRGGNTYPGISHTQPYGGDQVSYIDSIHPHVYGMPLWYFITGDEQYKEWLDESPYNILNSGGCLNVPYTNCYFGPYQRGMGIAMLFARSVMDYYDATGQTASKNQVKNLVEYAVQNLQNPIEMSGTDVGQTYPWITDSNFYQFGTNTARGAFYPQANGDYDTYGDLNTACGSSPNVHQLRIARINQPYQAGMIVGGMSRVADYLGSGWTYYKTVRELLYGITMNAVKENSVYDASWNVGGLRYSVPPDVRCSATNRLCECSPTYNAHNYGAWEHPAFMAKFAGDTSYRWLFELMMQRTESGLSTQLNGWSEQSGYNIADTMYWLYANPPQYSLQTVTTGFAVTDLGGGSYKVDWTAPSNVQEYRLKYKQGKNVVDWLNYDVTGATGAYFKDTFVYHQGTTYTDANWLSGGPSAPGFTVQVYDRDTDPSLTTPLTLYSSKALTTPIGTSIVSSGTDGIYKYFLSPSHTHVTETWTGTGANSTHNLDLGSGTFGLDPATNQPFFSSTFTATQPAADASTITLTGLPTGLTASNFMLKVLTGTVVTSSSPSVLVGGSVITGRFVLSGKSVMQ